MKRLAFFIACLFAAAGGLWAGEDVGAYISYVLINGSKNLTIEQNAIYTNQAGVGSVAPVAHTAKGIVDIQYERGNSAQIVSATGSAIIGGRLNTVSGGNSFIGAGSTNTINNTYSGIVGGLSNTISGSGGFIGGGYLNSVSGNYAGALPGVKGVADSPSQVVHSVPSDPGSGFRFQKSEVLAYRLSTDSTALRLTPSSAADASGNRWLIASGTSYVGRVYVSGVATDTTRASVGYVIGFKVQRVNSTVSVATCTSEIMEDSSLTGCSADVLGDSSTGSFYVQVVGSSTCGIRWSCVADYVESNQP